MNILNKLSIKNLKLNKKRTISTIIGIILSCSLICAVATMVSSFRETLVQNAINETGYYHLKISGINEDELEKLEYHKDIKDIYTLYENGYAFLENGKNEDKPYLKLHSMNKDLFDYLNFNLIKGNFPTNDNEIVISKHIITNGKVNLKVGDKITLNIGERKTLDGYSLDYTNPYNEELEQLVNTKNKEFTIVGIIERPYYDFENSADPGYTIITTNLDKGIKKAYISLKNPKDYKNSIAAILGATSYDKIMTDPNQKLKYENFQINNELLRWEAFAFGDQTVLMLFAVASVVIFVIIFTSVFCIRNSFAISTTEKMKMYGMLSSVGATKKQIKKNVIFEALILGLIGIPLGIICGILAVFALIKIVNMIAGEYLLGSVDGIVVKITILPIILSVILSIITIYLSALSSSKKASKVNPIELLRNSEEIEIKSKKLKVPFIISKLFKTGGELAYKNLKRSKKKYKTTVLSLTVSIFIFITMNALVTNMFNLSGNYYENYDYNIKLSVRGNGQSVIEKILKLDNIDEYHVLYDSQGGLKIFDLSKVKINERTDGFELPEDAYYDEELKQLVLTGKGKYITLEIIALDNNSYLEYLKKIGVNKQKLQGKGILCDNYLYYENAKQIEKRTYEYKQGDTIKGEIEGKNTSFVVGAITDIRPFGMEKTYYRGGYLIVNYDDFKNMDFVPSVVTLQSSDPDVLIDEIKTLDTDKIGYTNLDEQAKEERAMNLVIQIFLYGFITVITLIGVTNIFNTITSNMELRQKEFAMLKSIGMTKKEFNRMINLETIFYSSKSLIYGIILGLLGTFALYKAFSVKIDMGMYIPIVPIIISGIAVFILVFIIMKYSMSKIDKQNTIETIRNENI
ncbi:MAG: ABC transporter permease [Bacilli bacterium]|nr:ABC transporter permease [Bacilli bacterium]